MMATIADGLDHDCLAAGVPKVVRAHLMQRPEAAAVDARHDERPGLWVEPDSTILVRHANARPVPWCCACVGNGRIREVPTPAQESEGILPTVPFAIPGDAVPIAQSGLPLAGG